MRLYIKFFSDLVSERMEVAKQSYLLRQRELTRRMRDIVQEFRGRVIELCESKETPANFWECLLESYGMYTLVHKEIGDTLNWAVGTRPVRGPESVRRVMREEEVFDMEIDGPTLRGGSVFGAVGD
jgi:hypothetical protein